MLQKLPFNITGLKFLTVCLNDTQGNFFSFSISIYGQLRYSNQTYVENHKGVVCELTQPNFLMMTFQMDRRLFDT